MATRFLAKGYALEPGVFANVAPIGVSSANKLVFSPDGTEREVLVAGESWTGQMEAPDGSVSAPSYSFADDSDSGLYRQGSGDFRFSIDGSARHQFATATYSLLNDSAQLRLGILADTILARDAANALAQRNGTNAQTLRVYNTYTDASNYERLSLRQSGSDFAIFTEKAGTGTARAMIFGTNATAHWAINTSGHFVAVTDNAYDIGASGANRPRTAFIGTNIFLGGSVKFNSPTDGVLTIADGAGTNFSRLQFGGTTSSFPSLKRSSAEIHVRTADDSTWANITGGTTWGITSIGTDGHIKLGSTATIRFGTGTPEGVVTANVGSLFLRTDGGANTTLYVKESGTGNTGWVAK